MPIMSVNVPAYANEYMSSLVGMVTFDPLPENGVQKFFGFDFTWTDKLPTVSSVARIGIRNRTFI